MYRTLLATCGSAEMVIRRRCVQIVQTSVNRRATRATCGFIFLRISILTSEPKSGIHRKPDVALFCFKVGDSRFSLRDCQRPAGAGRATCGRGSHDLRARVTRPAGAGHATCGRGSLTMCRSETGMTQSGMAIPDMKIPHVAGFSWGCHVRNVRYVLCQCSSIE